MINFCYSTTNTYIYRFSFWNRTYSRDPVSKFTKFYKDGVKRVYILSLLLK